jgi:hypothetical protein
LTVTVALDSHVSYTIENTGGQDRNSPRHKLRVGALLSTIDLHALLSTETALVGTALDRFGATKGELSNNCSCSASIRGCLRRDSDSREGGENERLELHICRCKDMNE